MYCARLKKAIYKYIMYQPNTTTFFNYYFFLFSRETCFDSYRIIFRPLYDTDPYLVMFKMRFGIPNAYMLDITMYKMHVSLNSNPYTSLNSPLGGLKVFEAPRISRQSTYECDNIFSPTHRPPLAPEEASPDAHFCLSTPVP